MKNSAPGIKFSAGERYVFTPDGKVYRCDGCGLPFVWSAECRWRGSEADLAVGNMRRILLSCSAGCSRKIRRAANAADSQSVRSDDCRGNSTNPKGKPMAKKKATKKATKKAAKKAAKKRAKQTRIPGTFDPVPDEVQDAADEYYETLTERMATQAKENELREDLIGLMKTHGVQQVEILDGAKYIERSVDEKESVKVKTPKKSEPERLEIE